MLVGVANPDVAGSICPVVVGSHGKSMGVGWTKTGLTVGPVVLDVVGVVNMVLSGSVSMREGGGSVGMVVLTGGCDTLVLHIILLVVGVGASWGALRVVWGSMMLLVVRVSPCALPSLSYSGTLLV